MRSRLTFQVLLYVTVTAATELAVGRAITVNARPSKIRAIKSTHGKRYVKTDRA